MIDNINEILYTPIDSEPVPNYDLNKLLDWVKNHQAQELAVRRDSSKHETLANVYPWDIVYPKHNGKWKFDFKEEFPEIANYFSSAFKLNEKDINSVVLLPIKNNFTGTGFWHNDPDPYGLRIYLENEEPGEFLLIKPTVEPYNEHRSFGPGSVDPVIPNIKLQNVIHSAKLKNSRQVFYLNTTRAVHAVQVPQLGKLRIAVIVTVFGNADINNHLNNLICTSADKFSEHALYWHPE